MRRRAKKTFESTRAGMRACYITPADILMVEIDNQAETWKRIITSISDRHQSVQYTCARSKGRLS